MGLLDFLQKKRETPPEALVLWVHRRDHMALLAHLREVDGGAPATSWPINDVFGMTLALATNEGPVPAGAADLESMRLTVPDAIRRALDNCARAIGPVGIQAGLCVWQSPVAEVVAILGASFTATFKQPLRGRPVAMIPAQGVALMAGADDADALGRMLDLAETVYGGSEEFRTLQAIWWPEDVRSEAWLPPAGHPLRARFAAAAARSRQQEAPGLHRYLVEDGTRLAPLAAMPAERGGALVGAWARGATVILPCVDRVALVDTEDAPDPLVVVDLERLREAFPKALEAIAFPSGTGRAVLYRARGACFPTPAERALLASGGLVRSEAEAPADPRPTLLDAGVLPMVRPPGYAQAAAEHETAMIRASLPGAAVTLQTRVTRPLAEELELELELVADHGDRVVPLDGDRVTGAERETAWRSAMLNLRAASVEPLRATATKGVYEGGWRDDFDATRLLLLPEIAAECAVAGVPLLFAPAVSRVWVTGSEDRAGIAAVLDAIDAILGAGIFEPHHAFRTHLAGGPWIREGGQIRPWTLLESGSLAERIRALDSRLTTLRERSRKDIGRAT